MFDPPDFPFKDLSDTLKDHYDPEDILLSGPATSDPGASKSLAEVTEQMIASVENQLSFHSNDTGRFFNIENGPLLENISGEQSTELYIVQPNDTLFNYEHTLLDENTVNQFLLPLQTSEEKNKGSETGGPDVLALHSCVICHDIFITEADLLDHTIAMHASNNAVENEVKLSSIENKNASQAEDTGNDLDFETEWLLCTLCQRVLSTALEVEPSELLCCIDASGKANMSHKKLHTMFVCEVCNALFASGEALDNHRGNCYVLEQPTYYAEQMLSNQRDPNQGPEILFSCDTCCKQYMTAEDLKIHSVECQPAPRRGDRRAYSANKSTKMWNCGSCNQLFSTARELYRHKRGEDRQPGAPLMVYTCEECDKVLGSMCALHTHKKMHKVSKPGYPCRVCGRRFNQSGHLAIHMRMHTGERPYPCDLCSKAFKVKVERDDHRRTHTGERPFACTACPKTFTAAARLREHARIHTDQRPYRCDICGAAFRRPYARTVHTLIHTGEKPHECDVCGTAFRRSGDMWKHKRTLHGILPTDI